MNIVFTVLIVLAAIVVVAAIALGALYIWFSWTWAPGTLHFLPRQRPFERSLWESGKLRRKD